MTHISFNRPTATFLKALAVAAVAIATMACAPPAAKAMGLAYTAYRIEAGRVGALVKANDFVRSGEKLAVHISYINESDVAAPAGSIVFSLPEGCRLAGAEQVRGMSVSVDGGHAFGTLDQLTVTRGGQLQAASADDVTHLRLTIDHSLPAGGGGEVTVLVALR